MRNDGYEFDQAVAMASGRPAWRSARNSRCARIAVRAPDTYGEVAPTVSTVMRLDAGGDGGGGGQNGDLSVVGRVGLLAVVVVGLLTIVSARKRCVDRFGDR